MATFYRLKTSRNIGRPFDEAVKRQDVQLNYMASDLGVSKQALSNTRHGLDTTPEKAMLYSDYMGDSKLNQQLAAIYFEAVAMFDPTKWAKKFRDAPTMTWYQLRLTEQSRLELGEKVFEFAVKDRKDWTDKENTIARDWVIGLLKTISLSSLLAQQFSELAKYDLSRLTDKVNKQWGGLK